MRTAFDIETETRRLDAERPRLELIEGVEVQKALPMTRHALLQGAMYRLLFAWAGSRGYVGPEFRFWLNLGPERPTSLVPDVAYVEGSRLRSLSPTERQRPPIAPDIAVEIRSPDDRERNIERKIELYLARGTQLLLDVDPDARTIVAYGKGPARTFRVGEIFTHATFDDLSFDVTSYLDSGDIYNDERDG